ncbi:MAG: aminotransferase class V-fold PLP-dependent enzyme [Candidatus Zambryskibacteria bacterium]|nr:aminotransferase class V-fold PLP-dependent enzyme [Candidatus Zambryskibacteria bacterium]
MNWFKRKRIFLDYASATPVLPEVLKTMENYWSREFYNPNAIYAEGETVKKEMKKCRHAIASILGVNVDEVIFTSGGTEANVLAVRGVRPGKIIFEEESHPSVSEAIVENKSKEVVLVSSVTTDNKLGRQIRKERKKNPPTGGPLLHVDASQTAQYFDVSLERLSCDMLTLDSAKLYGPKGIGALVVRRGVKLNLPPRGTLPAPLIVGFTKALEIAVRDRESEFKRLDKLADDFAKEIQSNLPNVEVNKISPNIVNVSVPGILPEFLVLKLDSGGVMVSAGPACNANKPEPRDMPVRFSLGRFTTLSDLKRATAILIKLIKS